MNNDKKSELLKAIAVLTLSAVVLVLALSNVKLKAEIKELWFRHEIVRQEIESLYAARYRLEREIRELSTP